MAKAQNIDYERAVYGLHGPDGKIRFIGQTNYVPQRVGVHRYNAKKGNHRNIQLYQWMREVGPENVKAVILEKLPTDDKVIAGDREFFHIREHKKNHPDIPLLNMDAHEEAKKVKQKNAEYRLLRKLQSLSKEELEALMTKAEQKEASE